MSEPDDEVVEFTKVDLAVIDFRPGDTVVLMFPQRLSCDYMENLNESWKKNFPDIKCVVLADGARLGVIRATDGKTP